VDLVTVIAELVSVLTSSTVGGVAGGGDFVEAVVAGVVDDVLLFVVKVVMAGSAVVIEDLVAQLRHTYKSVVSIVGIVFVHTHSPGSNQTRATTDLQYTRTSQTAQSKNA
jgi:hypothetical protein